MNAKYYIASWNSYYPGGALSDICGAYETAEAAIADANTGYRRDFYELLKIEDGLIYIIAEKAYATDGWQYREVPELWEQFFSHPPKKQ